MDIKEDINMIEVLFSESAAGSMKLVKQENMFPERIEDVICLNFMLDIGDIQKDVDSQYRQDLMCSMFFQGQYEEDEITEKEIAETKEIYIQELKRLKEALNQGKEIRVWYSDAPYSLCGFYYLCKLLEKYNQRIVVVKLPDYQVEKNRIICNQNWGEIATRDFVKYLKYEKELTKQEIQLFAFLWDELVEDNSPMRALVNGHVIGVPEDFYDHLIWKHLSLKPIREAYFIGMLFKYQISVPDWWYAKRINEYIQQGKIKVIKDSKSQYQRMISF